MAPTRGRLPVPYARLGGTWDVVHRTADGRTAIAIRDDERAGVAIGYPYAEEGAEKNQVLKVAVVRNVHHEYVLVSASFVTLDAVDDLAPASRERKRIALEAYNRSSDEAVRRLLSGGRLVLIDVGQERWYPGALQTFDDPTAVRDSWLEDLPRVRERSTAVERILKGLDLQSVVAAGGDGPRVPSP